jgi:endogenous inhibitor of DNA gyrase (YacG/DUF329 family)
MSLISSQQTQQLKCPHCGADLQLIPPPPGAITLQVITTLYCPVCGRPVITVPTSGYRLEVVQIGQGTTGGPMPGVPFTGVLLVQCPKCGHWFTVVRGSAATLKNFQCSYCGTSLGSFPTDSRLIDLYLQTTPQGGQQQPSFWEKYKWYIIGGAVGLVLLLVLLRRR